MECSTIELNIQNKCERRILICLKFILMMKRIQLMNNTSNCLKSFKHAAKEEGISGETEVSVTFMSDEEIQKVNAEYRGIDEPTDVISFALEEMTEGEVAIIAEEGMPSVLGDIIISVETAKRQAEEYGHDFES